MVEESTRILSYAIRTRVVARYVCQLLLMLGVLTLVPLLVALFDSNWLMVQRYVVICLALFVIGSLYVKLPLPAHIQDNEAMAVTALIFICSPLIMSWPMMASNIHFIDALFEAVSGVTTTGLSTLGSIEHKPVTFLFARAWTQWYGGLGIIILSVALVMGHRMAIRRLMFPEESSEILPATARMHAQHTIIVYVVLTVAGFLLVWLLSGNGLSALLLVLSAVSTGGFSNYDASLAGLVSRPAAVAVMIIAVMGAVSLPLYWHLFHVGKGKALRDFITDLELRSLLITCLITGILLTLLGWVQNNSVDWYQGLMMGVSAQTTAGFATSSVADMNSASKLVMIISMFIGGSVGSSAGGIKLLRLLILLRVIQLMFRRAGMPPHAVAVPYLAGQRLEDDDIIRALRLIVLFIIIIAISWLPFLLLNYDPLDALFEVVSACGTVGLSSGISQLELHPFLKGVLCFDMVAGRLEIIALLILLYPRSWLGRKGEA